MAVTFKKYHRTLDHSYAFGVFPTLEMLTRKPEEAMRVFLLNDQAGGSGIERIHRICREHGIPVDVAPRAIQRLGGAESPAVGVFAKYTQPIDPQADHVVLMQPQYMGNLGTIIRTMVGFGFRDLVLIRPATDILAPTVVRSSMGAIFHLRWTYYDDFETYREAHDHRLYCLMSDGQQRLDQVAVHRPLALVFGNEGEGLPAAFHTIGTSVRIAQTTEIDSLNLAMAVGITLHHVATVGGDAGSR